MWYISSDSPLQYSVFHICSFPFLFISIYFNLFLFNNFCLFLIVQQVVISAVIFLSNILVIAHATRDPYNVRKVCPIILRYCFYSIMLCYAKAWYDLSSVILPEIPTMSWHNMSYHIMPHNPANESLHFRMMRFVSQYI